MAIHDAPTDITVENHGSLAVVQPLTARATKWIDENVIGEQTWWAGGLVVEPRYLNDLVAGMTGDGLVVET